MARSKQAGLKARAITRTDGMSVAGGPLSRRAFLGVVAQAAALAAAAGSVGCTPALGDDSSADGPAPEDGAMTWGTQAYRGFTLDNVFHAPDGSDVHFSLYVPQGVTLGAPGHRGQGLPGRLVHGVSHRGSPFSCWLAR